MPIPSRSSKTPPALRVSFQKYVIEPTERIVFVLLWGGATAYLTLWLIIFFETIILHFSHIWATSFPTSIEHFWHTPIALALACVLVLCWTIVYTAKQTKQAYRELCVWMVSNTLFQRLAWTFRRAQEIASFLHLSVVVQSVETSSESEIPAKGGTLQALGPSCVSRLSVLPEEQVLVSPGIFGTVLSTCQIRVVGPTGREKVVELCYSSPHPLWLYLVARAEASNPVTTSDILRDLYGYSGLVENPKTGQMEDPKARLLNRFHYLRRSLQSRISEACAEVGHPETKILLSEKRQGTTDFRLSDEVQIEDLTRFKACRTLLAGFEEIHTDEAAYLTSVKATSKRIRKDIDGLPHLLMDMIPEMDNPWFRRMQKHEMRNPWVDRLLKEALNTYSDALQYLAIQANAEVEETPDEETKLSFRYREQRLWSTYALNCAHMATRYPEEQETLIAAGELALQKALSCSLFRRDPLDATIIYYDFQRLVDGWKPDTATLELWQQIGEMDE